MLFEFLGQHKKKIIQLCRDKVLADSESKPTSALLDRGLPIFYDELVETLSRRLVSSSDFKDTGSKSKIKESGAKAHGKESSRLGYTISQVVHTYGAVCQSITEFVQTNAYKITPREFQVLNLSLDFAIAESVTEFERAQKGNVKRDDAERLGSFIHELGNSLSAAAIAHTMIRDGHVGSAGSTSRVLSMALDDMRRLIDGSLAEIRMRGNVVAEVTEMRLLDVISEVEATAMVIGKSKKIHLEFDVAPSIYLTADRHLIFSALSNLVNNAIKFTKKNGNVSVRGKELKGRILIEVNDECGGLPKGESEELFKPFIQNGADKSGVGLGLSLSRRAIELNQGKLTVRNIPGKGCIFTIDLPKTPK